MGLKDRLDELISAVTEADDAKNVIKTAEESHKKDAAFAPLSLKILSAVELELKQSIHSK